MSLCVSHVVCMNERNECALVFCGYIYVKVSVCGSAMVRGGGGRGEKERCYPIFQYHSDFLLMYITCPPVKDKFVIF